MLTPRLLRSVRLRREVHLGIHSLSRALLVNTGCKQESVSAERE